MRIVFMGDGVWAHGALRLLQGNPDIEILEVVGRHSAPDQELKKIALEFGLPFRTGKKINSPEYVAHFQELSPDLLVSMSYDQIYKPEILSIPKVASINCHAGALPFYRGRNIINWALINGEKEIGVTVHEISPGIDEGDIIVQEFFPVNREDDYGSVLLKAQELCPALLNRAVQQYLDGTVTRKKQSDIDPVGSYCRRRKLGDEWIDWNWGAEQIFNFVRGIAPPAPGAQFTHGGNTYALIKCTVMDRISEEGLGSGKVMSVDEDSILIMTGDGAIKCTDIRRITQGEMASTNSLTTFQAGDLLSGGPDL